MIVKIAAFLYFLQAALCLASLSLNPFGFSFSMENIATLLVGGLFGAMGAGLLKRESWARWLALGNSLLGWTLGTLVFLVVIGGAIFLSGVLGVLMGGGLGMLYGFIVVVLAVIFIASIVISFKLYFYLRSEAGAQEFGVEPEPFSSVMGSVGTWFVIAVVQGMMTSSGFGNLLPSGGSHEKFEQTASQDRADELRADMRRRQANAERERLEQIRLETERLEAERLEAERLAQMEQATSAVPEPTHMTAEAVLPPIQPESGETSRNQILKCRDASGSVQYTQGYCPPGTTRVEMPAQH